MYYHYGLLEELPTGVVATPLKQTDWATWPNQRDIREVRSWSFSVNPSLIPPPNKPLNQYDWPLPRGYYRQNEEYTWVEFTGIEPPPNKPFNQFYWPLIPAPYRIEQTWIQTPFIGNIPPSVQPFNQYDWPNPKSYSRLDETWVNHVVYAPAPPLPFNTYDWPNPRDGRDFRPWVWAVPEITPPPSLPFNQLDWSVIRANPRLDATWINKGIQQITVFPQPFNQYDWKLPVPIYRLDNTFIGNLLPLIAPPPPIPQIFGGGRRWKEGAEELSKHRPLELTIQQAAAVLSKMGGHARAQALTAKQRSNIATVAANARWGKK